MQYGIGRLNRDTDQAMEKDGLCYCIPGAPGHVHGAKVSPLVWAEGVLAIEELAKDNMATWAPRLKAKDRKAALRIILEAARLKAKEGRR